MPTKVFREDNLGDVQGDLGNSDEEGGKEDIHNDALLLRTILEGSRILFYYYAQLNPSQTIDSLFP